MAKRQKKLPVDPVLVEVEGLSHEGRGVARVEGKTVFIEGALPGETVRFVYTACRRDFDEGRVVELITTSPERVTPRCAHFGVCGGCSLQHLDSAAQLGAKQQTLIDNLTRLGKVAAPDLLPPLTGPVWGYRRKARLGVRHVLKKGRVLVGFRERQSRYLADLERCEVLVPQVGERLRELGALIAGLACRDQIAQIEVAAGDEATVLVFRHLVSLEEADRTALSAFGETTGLHIWLQPGGPETAAPLYPVDSALSYRLPAQVDDGQCENGSGDVGRALELGFLPTDFTQVNGGLNPDMVTLALDLLAPTPDERVLDLFCGLGNFSLPLAQRAGTVVGVEGEAGLVARARTNAQRNGIDNIEFHTANLAEPVVDAAWLRGQRYARILLDPPRTGADALLPQLRGIGARRIVYVSCNPATLARDAGILVHELGYRLSRAGVMDMFPHTAHVESIAVFELP